MNDGFLPVKNMFMKRQLREYNKRKREVRATYFKNREKSVGPKCVRLKVKGKLGLVLKLCTFLPCLSLCLGRRATKSFLANLVSGVALRLHIWQTDPRTGQIGPQEQSVLCGFSPGPSLGSDSPTQWNSTLDDI